MASETEFGGCEESDGFYRALFHRAGAGIIVIDVTDGRIVEANEKFRHLLAYREDELIGTAFAAIIHPDDRERSEAELERLLHCDGAEIHIAQRFLSRDDTTVWASLDTSLLLGDGEHPPQAIAIIRDVSAQTAAEQALQQSRERFRLITETIDAVLWLSDPGLEEMLYVSPAYERIWGRSCTSLYQRPRSFIEAIHPDDRAYFEALNLHGREQWECEYPIVWPDGSVRWIHDRGSAIRDHAGELKGLTGLALDVTDRKSKELKLSETVRALGENAKHLERMNLELQQFAGIVSHDLKAPLRAISGLVGMLSEDFGGAMAADAREHMNRLQERIRSMEGIISGLLEYARSSQAPNPRPVNVNDLVLQQLESLDIPDGFTVEIGSRLPTVTADPLQLGQIFSNLIDNAIRHHDRSTGRVLVNGSKYEQYHEFSVEDDGPGIPEGERRRVFEMFKSGKHHGMGSTGIGLALVKKLVEENGGSIVLSSSSCGSTFTFRWPTH